MHGRLASRRVLVTQADDFMGPAVTELFREEGANVVADTRDLRPIEAAAQSVAEAGSIDVLVANLIAPDRKRRGDGTLRRGLAV